MGRWTRASRRRNDESGQSSQTSNVDGSSESDPTDFTYFGYIEDVTDAQLVIEGCVRKMLKKFSSSFDTSTLDITSGVVVVIMEAGMRWRDKLTWSPSRAYGPFLLYREVEVAKDASQPLVNAKFRGLTRSIGIDSGIAPTFSSKTLKPGTRVVEGGFTKRTITLTGSDGMRYRLISYARADDIRKIRLNATDASEEYRTLSNELVAGGEVPALTRPSQDDKFKQFPGFPSSPKRKKDKETRKQTCREEPLIKKPKWCKKNEPPTEFQVFEPRTELSQASLSNANETSCIHPAADGSFSSSQIRRMSATSASAGSAAHYVQQAHHSTTDRTQPTTLASTVPASTQVMRAIEHSSAPSSIALHSPVYYLSPPPAYPGMHPAYAHPNFAAPMMYHPSQQPRPVMYAYVEQPLPYAAFPPYHQFPVPPARNGSSNYSEQASHLNLHVPMQPIPSSFVSHHSRAELSQTQQDHAQPNVPLIQYHGYLPPPPPGYVQSAHSTEPYPQYCPHPGPDPTLLYQTTFRHPQQ
ncbi:hypothetical protein BC830DRAFT_458923 [Chytriomyces sp. MP71]|nr:hypothetical protein BC830DRAFT_458923 [Chytriomyces sp. MP71]